MEVKIVETDIIMLRWFEHVAAVTTITLMEIKEKDEKSTSKTMFKIFFN